MLFNCYATADILTKFLQQCFLFLLLLLYLGNSQVSVYRTIGPTLVLSFSHGVFDRETATNFSKLLQIINETGGILRMPHPLQQCPFTQIDQFHLDLVQYCVEHDLQHLLWSYCSTHRYLLESEICPDEDQIELVVYYTSRKLCLWAGILFSRCPSIRASVRL